MRGKKKVLDRQAGLRECACEKWNSTAAEVSRAARAVEKYASIFYLICSIGPY